MEEFEPTIDQINDEIKPAWENIKYLSEKLVLILDFPRWFIGGMLNSIASDFNENNNIKNKKMFKDKLLIMI